MRILATLGLLALPLGAARAGEPPSDQAVLAAIDQGRQAFTAGNSQEAIARLQKAITLIQERSAGGLAGFLPKRDAAAWDMGEIDTQSGQWGAGAAQWQWSQAQRRYTQKGADDGPQVEVLLSNSPQLVEAQRGMLEALRSPAMREVLKQQAGDGQKMDFIDEDGWLGMLTFETESCTLMALHSRVMVQISVNRGADKLAREFWAAIDRAGLAAAAK
jgi:hypothetical protein